MKALPYAEEINYWQTSTTSPDSWIDKTKKLITCFGGVIINEVYGNEPLSGRAAYMLIFRLEGDVYKIIWPVLQSKTHNERAARIQAVTMMYHDVKAKCMSASVLGVRAAFFSYLLLADGLPAMYLTAPELSKMAPDYFSPPKLETGKTIIDG